MRLLLFADIHVGSIKDTNYCYNVITDIIEKEVIFKKTDAVIILGDYFDRLFKVNEEYVSLAINIMTYLIRACERNKTKIRMIYGTESHEMDQYKLFNYHFTSAHTDIKLFNTVTEEELFPNVKILYMPEEYMKNKYDFYKNTLYSGTHYNYIFGHGVIEDGMPNMVSFNNKPSNNTEKKVPHFKSGELSAACDLSIWGHYHVHTKMDNVYYLGSLFRSSFGEEGPKGYGIIEDGKFTFVENTEAYVYKTYEFDSTSNIYNDTNSLIREINLLKKENQELFNGNKVGKIRIKFTPPESLSNQFKESLKDILANDKLIKTMIQEESTSIIEDAKEELDDGFGFVLDNSMNIVDKLHTFINKTHDDYSITLDELSRYINEPLKI